MSEGQENLRGRVAALAVDFGTRARNGWASIERLLDSGQSIDVAELDTVGKTWADASAMLWSVLGSAPKHDVDRTIVRIGLDDLSALLAREEQLARRVAELEAALADEEKLNAAYINLTHEMRDIARMLDTAGVATNLAGKDRVKWLVHEFNEMANERSRVHLLLTRAGMHPPRCLEADDTVLRLDAFITVVDGALNKLDWPNNSDIIDRVQSLARIIDSKDAALAAVYQDIRAALGAPVDVTDADREAATEEDAANGPDAREYYAERRALLRTVRKHAGEVARMKEACANAGRRIEGNYFAFVNELIGLRTHGDELLKQHEREQSDIRSVLSKAGHAVDTHAELMGVLLALAGDDTPYESDEGQSQAESPVTACWCAGPRLDIPASLPLLRGLTAIIAEPMRGGHPSILTRRQRIVRMYRAILVLAATHGVELDEHDHDDLREDGPVFDQG